MKLRFNQLILYTFPFQHHITNKSITEKRGLSAALYMFKNGFDATVYEKTAAFARFVGEDVVGEDVAHSTHSTSVHLLPANIPCTFFSSKFHSHIFCSNCNAPLISSIGDQKENHKIQYDRINHFK